MTGLPTPELLRVEQRGTGETLGWAACELPDLARYLGLPDQMPVAPTLGDLRSLPRVDLREDGERIAVYPAGADRLAWACEELGIRGSLDLPRAVSLAWGGARRLLLTPMWGEQRGLTSILQRPSRLRPEHLEVEVLGARALRLYRTVQAGPARLWRVWEDGDAFLARCLGSLDLAPVELSLGRQERRGVWALTDPLIFDALVAYVWLSEGGRVDRPTLGAPASARVQQGMQLAIHRALPPELRTGGSEGPWSRDTSARLQELAQIARTSGLRPPGLDGAPQGWVGLWRRLLLVRAGGALPDGGSASRALASAPSFLAWLERVHPELLLRLAERPDPAEQAEILGLTRDPVALAEAIEQARVVDWLESLDELLRLVHPWHRTDAAPGLLLDEIAGLDTLDPGRLRRSPAERDEVLARLDRLVRGVEDNPPMLRRRRADVEALHRARAALESFAGGFAELRGLCARLLPRLPSDAETASAGLELLAAYFAIPATSTVDPERLDQAWRAASEELLALTEWLSLVPGGGDLAALELARRQPGGADVWAQARERWRHLAEMQDALPRVRRDRAEWAERFERSRTGSARARLEAWLTTEEAREDPWLRTIVRDWLAGEQMPQDYPRVASILGEAPYADATACPNPSGQAGAYR